MRRPTLLEGMVVALLLSLVASAMAVLLHLWVGGWLVTNMCIGTITYLYIMYLLVRSRSTPGRITIAVLSALVLVAILPLPVSWVGIIALTLMAGVRACAYGRSLLTGILHGLLGLLGVGIALWAYRQSGSLLLTVWSFFLLQALFVYIQAPLARPPEAVTCAPGDDPFPQAHQAAQQALARLRMGTGR